MTASRLPAFPFAGAALLALLLATAAIPVSAGEREEMRARCGSTWANDAALANDCLARRSEAFLRYEDAMLAAEANPDMKGLLDRCRAHGEDAHGVDFARAAHCVDRQVEGVHGMSHYLSSGGNAAIDEITLKGLDRWTDRFGVDWRMAHHCATQRLADQRRNR